MYLHLDILQESSLTWTSISPLDMDWPELLYFYVLSLCTHLQLMSGPQNLLAKIKLDWLLKFQQHSDLAHQMAGTSAQ